jgi:MFS family permease
LTEAAVKDTKKYSILEGIFFNGMYLSTQGFIMLNLALYFNANPFFIAIISILPTATQILQIFTKKLYSFFKTRKKTLMTSIIISRTSMIFLPVAVLLDLRNPYIFTAIIFIYSLFAPFVTNTWTAAMVEIINNNERGKYFGKRNFFISISSIFFTLIYGIFLAMPDKKTGYFILSLSVSISAIITVFLMNKHYIPDFKPSTQKISYKEIFKNKDFITYLKFVSVWLFSLEFLKPFFEYFRVKTLGSDPRFLANIGVLTAAISMFLFIIYGRLSDKYGNRTILRLGIFFATYNALLYLTLTDDYFKVSLVLSGIFDAVGFTAINLCFLNLLMEVSKEPAEGYIGIYSVVVGATAILAGFCAGILGTFINEGVIYVLGEKIYTIKLAFIIGFLLRLFSILRLTSINSFHKEFKYSGTLPLRSAMSKRITSFLPSYIAISRIKKDDNTNKNNENEE